MGCQPESAAVRLDQGQEMSLTTSRFLAPDGAPFGVNGLTPDRAFEGDDVTSLMALCADTKSTGPSSPSTATGSSR